MGSVRELIDALKASLATFGYAECARNTAGDVNLAAVLATPKRGRKFLCAVADLPRGAADTHGAAMFVDSIRRGLAKEFAGFPWPRQLGTYMVLLADHATCESLLGQRGIRVSRGGLHVNVLLGLILVDVDALRSHSDVTRELMDTGDQFRRIQAAVEQWCRQCRQPDQPRRPSRFDISLS